MNNNKKGKWGAGNTSISTDVDGEEDFEGAAPQIGLEVD